MVCKGKSHSNGWFRVTPMSGNAHLWDDVRLFQWEKSNDNSPTVESCRIYRGALGIWKMVLSSHVDLDGIRTDPNCLKCRCHHCTAGSPKLTLRKSLPWKIATFHGRFICKCVIFNDTLCQDDPAKFPFNHFLAFLRYIGQDRYITM